MCILYCVIKKKLLLHLTPFDELHQTNNLD